MTAVINNWDFRHRGKLHSRTEQYYLEAGETGDFWGEYAAKWRVSRWTPRFDYLVEAKSGTAEIKKVSDFATRRIVEVNAVSDVDIRFNIMYFPNWKVTVDGQVHDPIKAETCFISTLTPGSLQDDSGLIQCRIKAGEHILEAFYTAPREVHLGNLISLLGLGVIIWWTYPLFYQLITKKILLRK